MARPVKRENDRLDVVGYRGRVETRSDGEIADSHGGHPDDMRGGARRSTPKRKVPGDAAPSAIADDQATPKLTLLPWRGCGPEDFAPWLDRGETDAGELSKLLRPYQAALMACHPVSKRVNSVRGDDELCAAPPHQSILSQPASSFALMACTPFGKLKDLTYRFNRPNPSPVQSVEMTIA